MDRKNNRYMVSRDHTVRRLWHESVENRTRRVLLRASVTSEFKLSYIPIQTPKDFTDILQAIMLPSRKEEGIWKWTFA